MWLAAGEEVEVVQDVQRDHTVWLALHGAGHAGTCRIEVVCQHLEACRVAHAIAFCAPVDADGTFTDHRYP